MARLRPACGNVTLVVGALIVMSAAPAKTEATLYTVAGVTWDSDNAFTSAIGAVNQTDSATWPVPVLVGETQLSFGQLVVGGGNTGLRRATLGDASNTNTIRNVVTLSFDPGFALPNGSGPDLVVYEQGEANQPEGYAVAVRKYGSATYSDFRYQVWTAQEGFQIATTFDLTDFGLGPGEFIDSIQIMNLRQFVAGGSSVIDYTLNGGSGVVLTITGGGAPPAGYALPIGFGAMKDQLIPTVEFDPDISYAGGLHDLVNVAVPEASAFLAVGLAAAVSFVGLKRRRAA